jgi:hypothetical protein
MRRYLDYFDEDDFIVGDLNDLKREKSLSVTKEEHHFEIIEFDEEVMLAFNKEGNCSCTRHILNKSELLRLRDFISKFYPNE